MIAIKNGLNICGSTNMDQIFSTLSHFSLEQWATIITTMTGVVSLFFQGKGVKSDTHTIVYLIQHEPNIIPDQPNNTGCFLRSFLYLVIVTGATVFILSLNGVAIIPSSTTTLSPTQQAQNTIQLFYNDINKKDYQAAYNLTKDGFSNSYSQFAAAYNFTEHCDISFEDTKELSDGTIQVTVLIKATEKRPIETQPSISYYRNTYIVVYDHGGYVIVKGTTAKISA